MLLLLVIPFLPHTASLCRNWGELSDLVRFALKPMPIDFQERICEYSDDWYQDHFFLSPRSRIVPNILYPHGPTTAVTNISRIQLLEACDGEYTGPKPSQEIMSQLLKPAFEIYTENSHPFFVFETGRGVFKQRLQIVANQQIRVREKNGNVKDKAAHQIRGDDELHGWYGWTQIKKLYFIEDTAWRASSLCEGDVTIDKFTLRSLRTEHYPYELSKERLFMPSK